MLTPQQLPTLRTAILAVPANTVVVTAAGTSTTFGALRTDGATGAMADFFNQPSSPAFYVWRTSIAQSEVNALPLFDFTLVDNLTVGKARIWEWLFDNASKSIDPSKPNVRDGITKCWIGSGPLVAVGAAILEACKRVATRGERLFATGTGTQAAPGDAPFVGMIEDRDVVATGSYT